MTRRRQFAALTTTCYDAVVVGTSLSEAVLAAALARDGAKVLHLDANHFYGGTTATLSPNQLITALAEPSHGDDPPQPPSGGRALPVCSLAKTLFPRGARVLAGGAAAARIDLVPRPLMAAGPMIDLLVRCDAGHYVDFRPLEALYLQLEDGIRRVPASRADVFQSRAITMAEKRLLMRFVKHCYDSSDDAHDGRFDTLMQEMGLTQDLRSFLVHSIIFDVPEVPAQDGVNAVRRYQQSLIRFSTKTPFLYPNYGTGELAQAFCRLSAVHGGTYVLRRGAVAIAPPDNDSNGAYPVGIVTSEGETIHAHHVFLGSHLAHTADDDGQMVWRVAAVLDGSITGENEPNRILLTVPKGMFANRVDVRVRQLDSSVMVCESNHFVFYAETVGPGDEEDVVTVLQAYVEGADLDEMSPRQNEVHEGVSDETHSKANGTDCRSLSKPKILWGICYGRPTGTAADRTLEETEGVHLVRAQEEGIDADEIIREAERCFRVARPNGQFLPRAEREDSDDGNDEEIDETVKSSEIANGEAVEMFEGLDETETR